MIEDITAQHAPCGILNRNHAYCEQRNGSRCNQLVKISHQRGVAGKRAFVNPGREKNPRGLRVDCIKRIQQFIGRKLLRRQEPVVHFRIILLQFLADKPVVGLIALPPVSNKDEVFNLRSHPANQIYIFLNIKVGIQKGQIIGLGQIGQGNPFRHVNRILPDIRFGRPYVIGFGTQYNRNVAPHPFKIITQYHSRTSQQQQHARRILFVLTGKHLPELLQDRVVVHQQHVHMLGIESHIGNVLYITRNCGYYPGTPGSCFRIRVNNQYITVRV